MDLILDPWPIELCSKNEYTKSESNSQQDQSLCQFFAHFSFCDLNWKKLSLYGEKEYSEMEAIMQDVLVWNQDHTRREWKKVPTGRFKFTEEDRMAIVAEYVSGHMPASQIIEKYHLSSRQILFNWMDKYVNEKELVSLQDETNPSDPMAKKSPEDRVKELEAENKKLQKAMELEKLRSKAYDTMIDVAEETFNIPIRKKSGTKQ